MPVFQKRKRKNDEKLHLWSTLISVVLMTLIVVGLGLFVTQEETEPSTLSANTNLEPTNRIGLFIGHHYNDDALGAVCDDGLTERSINASVAAGLKAELESQGYTVDTFTDYNGALNGYRADLLLVLHVYGCMDDLPSGYRISNVNDSQALNTCLTEYEDATGLERQYDASYMGLYPRFSETAQSTPVLVIETGMLEADRYLLTQEQYKVVDGLANTVNCFSPLQTDNDA